MKVTLGDNGFDLGGNGSHLEFNLYLRWKVIPGIYIMSFRWGRWSGGRTDVENAEGLTGEGRFERTEKDSEKWTDLQYRFGSTVWMITKMKNRPEPLATADV